MRVSLKWLRSFVDFSVEPDELADLLTMRGVAVDEVERVESSVKGVVVGIVEDVAKHPNADRLSLCRVSTGESSYRVVCGAPNVKKGVKYPFALVGAVMPDGTKIRKAKIRGETSEGMLLSGYELGISDDHEGILELGDEAVIGHPLDGLIELNDYVFILDITANRMDLHSHLGVAREIGAIVGERAHLPEAFGEEVPRRISEAIGLKVTDTQGCPRYTARILEGVKVGPSPHWMVDRLASIGQRSINNIVDVTNFLLFELGTPLHAFDLDKLVDRKIIVRRAGEGEFIRTLDGVGRELNSEITVIADSARSVAIGGVMGGEDTEVSDDTVNVLIECAHFDPCRIRRTARALGLQSEASFRFERWVDPTILPYAVDRAAYLMKMAAGGDILEGRVDVYPDPTLPEKVKLRTERVSKILGQRVEEIEITSLLESVEFKVNGTGELEVEVPVFRARDVTREIDLIEEIARLKGYDWIDSDYKCGVRVFGGIDTEGKLERKVREFFVREGFFEVISTSFVGSQLVSGVLGVPVERLIQVGNPIHAEERFLRPLLLSTLIPILTNNLRKRNRDVRIFELGNVFSRGNLPNGQNHEEMHIAFAAVGSREPTNWNNGSKAWDYYSFKGVVERFFDIFLPEIRFSGSGPAFLDDRLSSSIMMESDELGFFGELSCETCRVLDIPERVFVLEIDSSEIPARFKERGLVGVSRFPPLERDLSLVVPEKTPYQSVEAIIRNTAGEILDELFLFDLYRGGQIPEGRKGLSFRLIFRSKDRTLEDREINSLIESILERLGKELDVVLR